MVFFVAQGNENACCPEAGKSKSLNLVLFGKISDLQLDSIDTIVFHATAWCLGSSIW